MINYRGLKNWWEVGLGLIVVRVFEEDNQNFPKLNLCKKNFFVRIQYQQFLFLLKNKNRFFISKLIRILFKLCFFIQGQSNNNLLVTN